MNKLIFSFLMAAVIFTGCENKSQESTSKKPIVFSNNMEPDPEWIGTETIKERPNAHSGKSVSVTDSVNQYSLGFNKRAGDASEDKIKKVVFSYWIFFKNANCKANSVISIDGDGKNIYWLGAPVQDRVKEYNKWVQVNEVFNIPVDIKPDNSIKLYVWNVSKEEILVDDLHITFN
jgi:hypothetical protein